MTEKLPLPSLRCGMVSIVGRPNVGKSTLLNKIVGEKVAVVSRVPQTTRNQIRGIYNDERGQIVFIDTPGLHYGKDKLDKYMNSASIGALDEVDCVVYLVDTSRKVGMEEENMADHLKSVRGHIILGLNKVDLKGKYLADYIAHWEKTFNKPIQDMNNCTMIALSGSRGSNVEKLIDIIFDRLPVGHALYPTDILSDAPQQMVISDIIREKFFHVLNDELPHSLGVVVEQLRYKKKKTLYIKATIFMERSSQKEIIIGKNGQLLKKVGTAAREELEDLMEVKIFLELFVKIQKNWRDNIGILEELGYTFH